MDMGAVVEWLPCAEAAVDSEAIKNVRQAITRHKAAAIRQLLSLCNFIL